MSRKPIVVQNLIDISNFLWDHERVVDAEWLDSVRSQIIDEHIENKKLTQVINVLQDKNSALELFVKGLESLSRNDFLKSKEETLNVLKKLQELDNTEW